MSLKNDLQNIYNVKNDIKNAIINQGQTVTDDFTTYSNAISNISSTPDGIFIQETTPTKTTSEALWLKEEDNGASVPLLQRVPSSMILYKDTTTTTFGYVLNNVLTEEQKALLNSKRYLLILSKHLSNVWGNRWYRIYGFDDYSFSSWSDGIHLDMTDACGIDSKENWFSANASPNAIKESLSEGYWCSNDIYKDGQIYIHKTETTVENGLYIDVDDKRYLVHTNKSNSWDKILDTSDANANTSDILTGKTAYKNNTKITGTMNNLGDLNIIPNLTGGTINSGYVNSINISAVTSSIDPNITANNIANGVNILGVVGTLDSGTNTADANATATDIVYGKTAYVNGVKINGSLNYLSDLGGDISFMVDNYFVRPSGEMMPFDIEVKGNFIVPENIIISDGDSVEAYIHNYALANAINLQPNQIAQGVTVLNVTGNYEGGTNTQDANALANDIAYGKTAYVNGVKLTGTLPEVLNPKSIINNGPQISNGAFFKPTDSPDNTQSGYGCYTVTGNTSEEAGNNYYVQWVKVTNEQNWFIQNQQKVKVGMPFNKVAETIKLYPNVIKSGTKILGITGNYQGAEVNLTNLDVTSNGIYYPESPYDGFNVVNVNISGGSGGDVILYNTLEEMNYANNVPINQLAIVYGEDFVPLTQYSSTNHLWFPYYVNLPKEYSGPMDADLSGENYEMFNAHLSFSGSAMNININYIDTEGFSHSEQINYTADYYNNRQFHVDSGYIDNLLLNTNVYPGYGWDDLFGYFVTSKQNIFSGLFQYGEHQLPGSGMAFPYLNGINFIQNMSSYNNDSYSFDNQYISSGYNIDQLRSIVNSIKQSEFYSNNVMSGTAFIDYNGNLKMAFANNIPEYEWSRDIYLYAFNNMYMNFIGLGYSAGALSQYDAGLRIYDIDLNNFSYSYNTTLTSPMNINTGYENSYLFGLDNVVTAPMVIFDYNEMYNEHPVYVPSEMYLYVDELTNAIRVEPNHEIYPDYNDWPFEHLNAGGTSIGYAPASTQFSTIADDVLHGSFYGMNGVETGTLGKTNDLTINEAKSKMQAVSMFSYLTLDPSINNIDNAFSYSGEYVSNINMDNIVSAAGAFEYSNVLVLPNFNLANLENAYHMFYQCQNLSIVPNFNLNNVKDASYMFCDTSVVSFPDLYLPNATHIDGIISGSRKLLKVPNIYAPKITSLRSMYAYCYNITEVPNWDTTNITDLMMVFDDCYNLLNIPNYDTSNVTTMYSAMSGCKSITDAPNWNTVKVTGIGSMFSNCINLINVPEYDFSNVTQAYSLFENCKKFVDAPVLTFTKATHFSEMFENCTNLVNGAVYNTETVRYLNNMYASCTNLVNVPEYYAPNCSNITNMFYMCNNLSNDSVLNIVNMIININISNISSSQRNLMNTNKYSPFYKTIFDNSYYSDKISSLQSIGWNC